MKKNILIAAYNLDFGGIEVSLINLLKNMDYKNMLHLLENDVTIKEKIDFAKLNKARIEKLEKLLEGENG